MKDLKLTRKESWDLLVNGTIEIYRGELTLCIESDRKICDNCYSIDWEDLIITIINPYVSVSVVKDVRDTYNRINCNLAIQKGVHRK